MSRCVAYRSLALVRLRQRAQLIACMALLATMAACGGRQTYHASTQYSPSRYYPPPGPSGDPWGPYIHEASGRFGVPEVWIRRVMRQESGGQEDVISWAGAMGLMQVMPETYAGLRGRYDLGDDPFDPHNNILAGTAYLREMYDRFGAPGFLAAYNAGPNRLDRYLHDGMPLPDETISYVASIAPALGPGTPLSGPLAAYAGPGGYAPQLASRQSSGGCDPDAAYDPDRPCGSLPQAMVQAAVYAAPAAVPSSPRTTVCDPDAAYDPTQPCAPAPMPSAQQVATADSRTLPSNTQDGCDPDAAYDPMRPCQASSAPAPSASVTSVSVPSGSVMAAALPQPGPKRPFGHGIDIRRPLQKTNGQRVAFMPASASWGIQVGAFANLATAHAAADDARMALPDVLRTAKIALPATTPFGGKAAFRARLIGLSPAAAADACVRLSSRGLPCITVPPARDTS